MTDDLPEEIRDVIGPHPVDELAEIIERAYVDDRNIAGPPIATAQAVYLWHQVQMLEHEHIQTAAQNWYDRNHHAVLPDWPGLYRILSGDRLEP